MGITPFFVENVSELQLCAIKLVTAVSVFSLLVGRWTEIHSQFRQDIVYDPVFWTRYPTILNT